VTNEELVLGADLWIFNGSAPVRERALARGSPTSDDEWQIPLPIDLGALSAADGAAFAAAAAAAAAAAGLSSVTAGGITNIVDSDGSILTTEIPRALRVTVTEAAWTLTGTPPSAVVARAAAAAAAGDASAAAVIGAGTTAPGTSLHVVTLLGETAMLTVPAGTLRPGYV
jgi:hypothetical protein